MINNKKLTPAVPANIQLRSSVLAGLVFAAFPLSAVAETLEQRVERLERALAEKEAPSQVQQLEGSTEYSFGGYIKLDAIASQYSDGERALAGVGDDFLVASVIPVGGESGDTNLDMHAKHSRIWFKTNTATDVGAIGTYIEMDFGVNQIGDERISNSAASRIRHAYLSWQFDADSSVLAGQTWSTFFNVASLPDTLDFVGPVGTLFERQAQVRWTHGLGNARSLMFALENPSSGLYGQSGSDAGASAYDNNALPDMVVRFNGKSGDFSYSFSGLLRELAYKQNFTNSQAQAVRGDDSVYGYGVSFAGVWQIGADDVRVQLNAGNALGRYLGLQTYRDGVIEDGGDIELIDSVGGYVAYRHFWAPKWRSSLVLSASSADNPDSVADTTAASYQSVHANLVYAPITALNFGVEYIHASKTIERPVGGDDSGDLDRLQFSAKYTF
ncbi:DcaP family trimeric outer membrane transporter [Zhongshania aquimaris]|uniref:Porin n=1 Tax=Zhongshania aquimaris TaxID=2857107 RepID=A0ABS6VUL4_9GAMM|nr:DcaP family trimeric outer membrane transporter [Zhongshania aquimaris]MBW2942012.1 porin [Zhongshania aquimaris]